MKKKYLSRIFQMTLGLLVGLLMAEAGTRLFWFGWQGFFPVQLNSFKNLGVSGLIDSAEDDRVLYEIKPNLDTLFKFKSFQTNSFGMRDDAYSQKKPAMTFRIAVLGDSFTLGPCLDKSEIYVEVLEENMKSSGGEVAIEVLNFGVSGYNLRNYQGVLETKVLDFEPDLVLIGFCGGNDYERPDQRHYAGDYKVLLPREMFWKSHFYKFFKEVRYGHLSRRKLNTTPTESELAFVDSSFAALNQVCLQHQIPMAVAFFSLNSSVSDVEMIGEQATKNQIPFVDASAAFRGLDPRLHHVHKLDNHPNAKAHQEFARAIELFLRERNLLPEFND